MYNLQIDGVTQSLLKNYMQCPRKALYAIQGWQSKKTAETTLFGTIGHKYLERHYSGLEYSKDTVSAEIIKDPAVSMVSPRQFKEDFELASTIAKAHIEYWEASDSECSSWTTEEEFSVVIDGVRIRGKIDNTYLDKQGALWVLDTKFKGKINEIDIMTSLPMDLQTHLYARVVQELRRKRVAGIIYNVVRRPQLRRKDNEGLDVFSERVYNDALDRPEFYFMRFRVSPGKADWAEAERDFSYYLKQYTGWAASPTPENSPRNTSACFAYGTGCPFLRACAHKDFAGLMKVRLFPELSADGRTTTTSVT